MDYTTLIMIALMVFAFYFLILRPQKKRQQAVQNTLNSLQPGDRVLLGSGVFGTILSLGDRQAVLEISPGRRAHRPQAGHRPDRHRGRRGLRDRGRPGR